MYLYHSGFQYDAISGEKPQKTIYISAFYTENLICSL